MAKNGTRKDKSCLFVGMLQPLKSKLLGPLKLGNNGSRSDQKGQSIKSIIIGLWRIKHITRRRLWRSVVQLKEHPPST